MRPDLPGGKPVRGEPALRPLDGGRLLPGEPVLVDGDDAAVVVAAEWSTFVFRGEVSVIFADGRGGRVVPEMVAAHRLSRRPPQTAEEPG